MARRTHAVFLAFSYLDCWCAPDGEDPNRFRNHKPIWLVRTSKQWEHERLEKAETAETVASHCPFCGQKVPDVRLRANPPKRVCTIVDGGYYCNTCGERLDGCRCAPPEYNWKVST